MRLSATSFSPRRIPPRPHLTTAGAGYGKHPIPRPPRSGIVPSRMSGKIRVMVADDHRTRREGIKLLLESEGDIEVVAEAEEGREAIATATKVRPDVVLMDVAL